MTIKSCPIRHIQIGDHRRKILARPVVGSMVTCPSCGQAHKIVRVSAVRMGRKYRPAGEWEVYISEAICVASEPPFILSP